MCNKILDLANSKIDSYASRTTKYDDDFISNEEFMALCRHLAVSGTLEDVDIREMWRDKNGILIICWDIKNIMGDYSTYKYHDLMWYPWG